MLAYALAIFFGAFLLFQVQPLIAKFILPWFGGGPAVWTACMLFFQVLLLGGYAYAHLVSTRLSRRTQAVVHLVVLGAAALLLPITPAARWKPHGGDDPTWGILMLLTASVGLPYFILSTTSPLLQAWFRLAQPGRSPYRLYALSNAGSLLALVSYPFLVEPALALRTQALVWSAGFCAFGLLCAWCAWGTWESRAEAAATEAAAAETEPERRPGVGLFLLWTALTACGSAMLLAVTNQMCADVAIVPFLWVLPLTLYLLTFILCFQSEKWYYRPVFWVLLGLAIGGMYWLLTQGVDASIKLQIFGFSGGMFICCMVCHGELVQLKPSPRYLTSFYLACALGGALGGAFVSLVAPRVFRAYLELPIAMWMTCLLAMIAFWVHRRPHLKWQRAWWVGLYPPAFVAALVVLAVALGRQANETLSGAVSLSRNFYGVLRVVEHYRSDEDRHHFTLQHGRISHGCQYVAEDRRRQPTTYYGEESGVGLAILHLPRHSGLRVGVVGLGTGTIAAYGQKGDYFRFYEINPAVLRLATSRFTYLAESGAKCEVALGDARLSLEREPPESFDVLALDAFTSDAIPIHLLTREAFAVYLRHLKPDGVLAVHISNRYLDLEPVVNAAADYFGLGDVVIDSESDDDRGIDSATWVLVSKNQAFLSSKEVQRAIEKDTEDEDTDEEPAEEPQEKEEPPPRRLVVWTDDYSDLFRILK